MTLFSFLFDQWKSDLAQLFTLSQSKHKIETFTIHPSTQDVLKMMEEIVKIKGEDNKKVIIHVYRYFSTPTSFGTSSVNTGNLGGQSELFILHYLTGYDEKDHEGHLYIFGVNSEIRAYLKNNVLDP